MFGPGAAPIVVLSKSDFLRMSFVWQFAQLRVTRIFQHVEYFDYCRSEHETGQRQKSAEGEYTSGQGEPLTSANH
jgi:hypothetical protein